jgi:hypothetical protein
MHCRGVEERIGLTCRSAGHDRRSRLGYLAPRAQPAGAKRNARRIDARQRLSTYSRVGLRFRPRAFSPARAFLWKGTARCHSSDRPRISALVQPLRTTGGLLRHGAFSGSSSASSLFFPGPTLLTARLIEALAVVGILTLISCAIQPAHAGTCRIYSEGSDTVESCTDGSFSVTDRHGHTRQYGEPNGGTETVGG